MIKGVKAVTSNLLSTYPKKKKNGMEILIITFLDQTLKG